MKLPAFLFHVLAMNSALAEIVADPMQHFRSQWDLAGVTKLYKLEVDINNDGLKEIFISNGKSDPPDVDDFGWQLYIAKPGGRYEIAGEKTDSGINPATIPNFKKDQYRVGLIPELNRHGLLHLECGRGGQAKCQLKAIVIEADGWKHIAIGQPVSAETNYEELSKRFATPPTPAVQEFTP